MVVPENSRNQKNFWTNDRSTLVKICESNIGSDVLYKISGQYFPNEYLPQNKDASFYEAIRILLLPEAFALYNYGHCSPLDLLKHGELITENPSFCHVEKIQWLTLPKLTPFYRTFGKEQILNLDKAMLKELVESDADKRNALLLCPRACDAR